MKYKAKSLDDGKMYIGMLLSIQGDDKQYILVPNNDIVDSTDIFKAIDKQGWDSLYTILLQYASKLIPVDKDTIVEYKEE